MSNETMRFCCQRTVAARKETRIKWLQLLLYFPTTSVVVAVGIELDWARTLATALVGIVFVVPVAVAADTNYDV